MACVPLFAGVHNRIKNRPIRIVAKLFTFSVLYITCTFIIIPSLAAKYGRVPMQIEASEREPLQPLTLLTVLLNRHYVQPTLKTEVTRIAQELRLAHKGLVISYLDANFPFWNGFPLLPHSSHNDGRKLDIAFLYKDNSSGKTIFGESPSWMGYGVCEEPRSDEANMPALCAERGYWQYSFLRKITPQVNKKAMLFDEQLTAELIRRLARSKNINKIFLEPHLKQRLGLQNISKIRFHGCQAVRHDDHIHIQL